MSASDSVFWAGVSQGYDDAMAGLKAMPTPPEDIDKRWVIDWRVGYAEGWYDGNMKYGVSHL
jgi:hypothetical protein